VLSCAQILYDLQERNRSLHRQHFAGPRFCHVAGPGTQAVLQSGSGNGACRCRGSVPAQAVSLASQSVIRMRSALAYREEPLTDRAIDLSRPAFGAGTKLQYRASRTLTHIMEYLTVTSPDAGHPPYRQCLPASVRLIIMLSWHSWRRHFFFGGGGDAFVLFLIYHVLLTKPTARIIGPH